jgi:hypothetical protein
MEVRRGSQSFLVFKPQRDDIASFGCLTGVFTVRLLYSGRPAVWIMKVVNTSALILSDEFFEISFHLLEPWE